MSRQATGRARGRNAPSPSTAYAQEVLSKSASILVKTGHSPKVLIQMFRQICEAIQEPGQPFDPDSIPYVSGLPHIIAHWYADPDYVDRHGEPHGLVLRGPTPSLSRLIARVFPHEEPAEVVRSLLKAGAIRRNGSRYSPVGRYLWLAPEGLSVNVHGLTSLVGMLRTVQHNILCTDERSTLLERAAANPCVPVRALPIIHRRIKRDVTALLWRIDGYLRRWEVAPGSEPTTRLGVGAYAYEDPIITGRRMGSKSVAAPRQRRTPGRSARLD